MRILHRATNLLFAAILVFVIVAFYLDFLVEFLPWIILVLGIFVLFLPIVGSSYTDPHVFFTFVRRWVFGATLIIIPLTDIISNYLPVIGDWVELIEFGSTLSMIILGLFALIYVLAAFGKTRGIKLSSAVN